jgi:hypothetical protein
MSRLFPHASPPMLGRMPDLHGATGWLNTSPLTRDDLRDRVVLVEFGTFTCINWLRTLPYVRAWTAAYGKLGLTTVVVQTPEFNVEHDPESVRRAMDWLQLDLPIAIDNNYEIWNAFANRYWPAMYIADADGKICHQHFGEGGYDESEDAIRSLVRDMSAPDIVPDLATPVPTAGVEVAADWHNVQSPETYVGAARSAGFASPGRAPFDEPHVFTVPEQLDRNEWALAGTWTRSDEVAIAEEPNSRIVYRFHARDLHLILPSTTETKVRFRIRLDGQPPGAAHGVDVDEDGNGVVTDVRLYQLVRQPGEVEDASFEIEFLDRGAGAYCFTFG